MRIRVKRLKVGHKHIILAILVFLFMVFILGSSSTLVFTSEDFGLHEGGEEGEHGPLRRRRGGYTPLPRIEQVQFIQHVNTLTTLCGDSAELESDTIEARLKCLQDKLRSSEIQDAGAINIGLSQTTTEDTLKHPNLPITNRDLWHVPSPSYLFNCSNIYHIRLGRRLGNGVSKAAFLGEYEGRDLVVKVTDTTVPDVRSCLKEKLKDREWHAVPRREMAEVQHECLIFPRMKMMKEILMVQQLQQHPHVIKMLGYCLRGEERSDLVLHRAGLVSVFERAAPLRGMRNVPLRIRLKLCVEVAELLDYFEHSPIGSLIIGDFKSDHLMEVDGVLRLNDLDDVSSIELACGVSQNVTEEGAVCDYDLPCIQGKCVGYNAKNNLATANEVIIRMLLHHSRTSVSREVSDALHSIQSRLDALSMTAGDLKWELFDILKKL